MSKPMVEKYEQMLAKDPSSTVFVELARAYLERGELTRAIDTCRQGLTHHPNSVVGRVLWGKALINAGKAAEAMQQFDFAVSIDRSNAHAYRLIGEALLQKGLYRSALPILRRAVALQPNDATLAGWLQQTQQALAGGPAPVVSVTAPIDASAVADETAKETIDDDAADAEPPTNVFQGVSARPSPPDVFAQIAQTPAVPDGESTVVMTVPVLSPAPVNHTQEIAIDDPSTRPGLDPFGDSAPTALGDEPDTVSGFTRTFDALNWQRSAEPVRLSAPVPVTAPVSPPVLEPVADADPNSAQFDVPTSEFRSMNLISPQANESRESRRQPPAVGGGLLDEIPLEAEAPELPSLDFNPQATAAIAQDYERELRAKLEVSQKKKTFWQAHGLKVGAIAGAVIVAMGLGGSYFFTLSKNQGETVDTAYAKGLAAVNADTKDQYDLAIRFLDQALKMDPDNSAALALRGYAHAMLFAEHGRGPEERQLAIQAFADPEVRNAKPDLAVVVDFLTADEATATSFRQQLLTSTLDKSVVQEQAGRLLLAEKKYDDALALLRQALFPDSRNTRALVALGEYYAGFEDWENALTMFASAEPLSPVHPARVLGHAEARLELGRELPEALTSIEALLKTGAVPKELQSRVNLIWGRALSANARYDEAIKVLSDGQSSSPALALDYALALGDAQRAAGHMAEAQKSMEQALKLAPKSEAAREGLGRVLLARSREKELVERLRPERDGRKTAVLRAIAFFRLGDLKRARQELNATQVGGKYPAEAVVYLALIDAAEEGQEDKAIATLEKLTATLKKNKTSVQVALARLYLQRGALDKAKAYLEQAAADPQDYEANAMLGGLLLKANVPPELALDRLNKAVERNGSHAPSRHLLVQTLLAMGKTPEAQTQIDEWTQDNPTLDLMWRDAARVFLEAGKLREAEVALSKSAIGSEDLSALHTRALILFARGDARGAMNALERANKLNPKDAATFCEIGNAFVRQGTADTAMKAYEAAVREDPKSICGLAGPYHARPIAKGKPLPREVLKQLIERSNQAWEKAFLQATLGRVLLAGGDAVGARESVDRALTLAPAHPVAWFALGEIAKRAQDDVKALEAYGKAAELDGSWSQARLAYADGLAKKGGDAIPKAVAQYEAVLLLDQNENDVARVKRLLPGLKKQLARK